MARVHLVGVQPLREHAAVGQVGRQARVELLGEERGHAAHPRVRRLRDDDVVLAPCRARSTTSRRRSRCGCADRRTPCRRTGRKLRAPSIIEGSISIVSTRSSVGEVRSSVGGHARAEADHRGGLRVRACGPAAACASSAMVYSSRVGLRLRIHVDRRVGLAVGADARAGRRTRPRPPSRSCRRGGRGRCRSRRCARPPVRKTPEAERRGSMSNDERHDTRAPRRGRPRTTDAALERGRR